MTKKSTNALVEVWAKMDFQLIARLFSIIDAPEHLVSPQLIGVSQNTLNSWERAGLLVPNSKGERRWRKYNLFDLLWALQIQKLRDFGVSTEHIKEAKESLIDKDVLLGDVLKQIYGNFGEEVFRKSGLKDLSVAEAFSLMSIPLPENLKNISLLKTMVLRMIFINRNIDVLLYLHLNKAYVLPYDSMESQNTKAEINNDLYDKVYIRTPLMALLNQLTEIPNLRAIKSSIINAKLEADLIELVRTETYSKVEVGLLNSRKMDVIHYSSEKRLEVVLKLNDYISNSQYQFIRVISQDGKLIKDVSPIISNTLTK